MRAAITLLLIAAVFIVALGFLAQALKRSSMFYPDRYPVGYWNPESFPVRPRDIEFRASDGVALHGWLVEASTADAPLLIWFHGNGGNLTARADVAAEFALRGISVFLFDYRGYGKSDGRPSENGLYRDSLAAFDVAVTQLQQDRSRIVLYGESLGGPYASYVAAERPGARCVVIENSFPSTASVARTIPGYAPFAFFVGGSLPTTKYLNRAGLPVLIMHGKRDLVIPYRLGFDLYESVDVPKRLFTSEKAGHAEIPYVERDRYYDAVIAFIREPAGLR
jgi:uncharacterized protein